MTPRPHKLYPAGTRMVFVPAASGARQPSSPTAVRRLLIGYPANSGDS
jgi:hypothetical protein